MTLRELRTQVRAFLNEPTPAFFSDAEITGWLNRAQEIFVRRCPVLEDIATADTNSGNDKYDVPGDFMRLLRVEYNGVRLQEVRLRDYDKLTSGSPTQRGTPTYYHLFNDFIRLWPIPSADGTNLLKMHYYRLPIEMEDDAATPEVPQDYDEVLVFYATSRGKMKDGEYERAEYYEQKFDRAVRDAQARIRSKTVDRFHVLRNADEENDTSYGII